MKIATKTEPNREKLAQLWDIGFRHIEVYTDQEIIEDPESTRILKEFNFEYVVHAPTDHFDMDVLDFANEIGSSTINTHKILTHRRLQELVDAAARVHIMVTVENDSHPATHQIVNREYIVWPADPLCSVADANRLLETVPGVMLCFDIEHAYLRGEYYDWVESLINTQSGRLVGIGHVHLTGYDHTSPKGYHRPVQESPHLVEDTIYYLARAGYKGFLMCEHDMQFHTPEIWKAAFDFCTEQITNTAEETLR